MKVFELAVDTQNLKSDQLIRQCKQLLSAENTSEKTIMGFKTSEKLHIIDYILSKEGIALEFLKNQTLSLLPIFYESKIPANPQKHNTNLNHFKITYMIGQGGFSKVFIGIQLN